MQRPGDVNPSAGLDEVQEGSAGEGELQHFGSVCNAVGAPMDDNVGHAPVDDHVGDVLVSAASELTGKAQTCRKSLATTL